MERLLLNVDYNDMETTGEGIHVSVSTIMTETTGEGIHVWSSYYLMSTIMTWRQQEKGYT